MGYIHELDAMSEHSNPPDKIHLVKYPFFFVTSFLQVPLFNVQRGNGFSMGCQVVQAQSLLDVI